MCREIIQSSAPKQFTQHARNPEKSVEIGGDNIVLSPAYGPPFIRNLDEGRRYANIEDFRNFVKLEEQVLITENGYELLSKYPFERHLLR